MAALGRRWSWAARLPVEPVIMSCSTAGSRGFGEWRGRVSEGRNRYAQEQSLFGPSWRQREEAGGVRSAGK